MADCPRKKAADHRKKENRERLRSETDRNEAGHGRLRNDRSEAEGRLRTRSEMSDKSGKILHFLLTLDSASELSRVLIQPCQVLYRMPAQISG